ncbi:DUF1146 family protein [Streptococcus cameli]
MMILFRFFSHLLFIYLSHFLLRGVIDWGRFVKGTAENQKKISLLLLFLAIALGYLVSNFFLDIMSISRQFASLFLEK